MLSALRRENLPNHVAFIMDGNGRWAKRRSRPRLFGHREGVERVRELVKSADEFGIKVISLYAFSEENWGRPETEVSGLMTLLNTFIVKERDELDRKNVQFRVMGNLDRLPEKTRRLVVETVDRLGKNTGLVVNVALSYGSRSEIVDACRKLAGSVKAGLLEPEDIDRHMFASALETSRLPDPDLLIRTSGEQRISNFLLWQLAYTEIYFTDIMWPEFNRDEFLKALLAFQDRQRRYGLLPGQIQDSTREAPEAPHLC